MKKLKSVHLKLNDQKTELRKSEIEFLGHLINKDGVQPDPAKVSEIKQQMWLNSEDYWGWSISTPVNNSSTNDRGVRKRQNMVIGRIAVSGIHKNRRKSVKFANTCLLWPDKTNYCEFWRKQLWHRRCSTLRTWWSLEACCLLLKNIDRTRAKIEKECLGAWWACAKFERYLIGLESFTLETDHKPLIPLINTKELHEVSIICQPLIMRLMRFNMKATFSQADCCWGPIKKPTARKRQQTKATVHRRRWSSHRLSKINMTCNR